MASIAPSPGVNAQTGVAAKVYTDEEAADFQVLLDTLAASVVEITGNTTLDPLLHNNRILQVNNAADVTLTLPATGPAGFIFSVDQVAAGKAIFAVQGAATKINRQNHDRTAGAGAQMSCYCRKNAAGNNAVYVLAGDGATS